MLHDFDEMSFKGRYRGGGRQSNQQPHILEACGSGGGAAAADHDMEKDSELEAILKKRRERLSSTPSIGRKSFHHHEDVRKTSSFRLMSDPVHSKFNTLPHRLSGSSKPRVPEKKPVFVREHSLKLQSWNRISSGNKCI